jgi:hypothetical protein
MADPISATERLRRALQWEKSVITFSFWLCVMWFLGPGVLLGRFVAPAVLDTTPVDFPVLVHMVVGGFIGLVALGTIIIAGNFLCRVAIDAVRAKTGSN